jgi:uncharacterized protein YuzE
MNFFYDRKGDVLYISLGSPQQAISKEVGEDILIRLHPENDEVVGFTIFNFAERFSNIWEERTIPLSAQFQILDELVA